MVRLQVPRNERSAKKRGMLGMSGQLSGITRFSDITALTGGEGQVSWTHLRDTHQSSTGHTPC